MAGLGIHQRVPAHLQGQGGIFTAVTPQPGHKDEEDGFFFLWYGKFNSGLHA